MRPAVARGLQWLVLTAMCANLTACCRQQPGSGSLQDSASKQPGIRWTEDHLKQAVAAVRAGKSLTPKIWPNQGRVAVCLSFDLDNESPTLAQGITLPVPLSGEQYGATQGLPRILSLLDREGLPASFYVPAV